MTLISGVLFKIILLNAVFTIIKNKLKNKEKGARIQEKKREEKNPRKQVLSPPPFN